MPHAFIVLTDENSVVIGGYGFAPAEHLNLWGPGKSYDDKNHEYDRSWSYDVTEEQFNDLRSYISQREQNPGLYEGWQRNCMKFVVDALRYANIEHDLPSGPFTHPFELYWRKKLVPQWLDKLIGELETNFRQAAATASPLILDLDGDGVETIDKSAGIHLATNWTRLPVGWARTMACSCGIGTAMVRSMTAANYSATRRG